MDQGSDDLLWRRLTPEIIRQDLDTRWLGKQAIHCLDAVESTNSEARSLAVRGAAEGTIVLAEGQTKGRGRSNRTWFSPRGKGLYLSVILRPRIPLEWNPRITIAAGVALATALDHMGIRPGLKWPNDVMLGSRKVAGILTEGAFDQTGTGFAIVGVGVNVNTVSEEFPVSIRELATSLRVGTGKAISRVTMLQGFLHELEQWYETLCLGNLEGILETWRRYATILGKRVEVCLPDSGLLGVAEDLDSDGALLVRDKMGYQHRIMAGDVRLCRVREGEPQES